MTNLQEEVRDVIHETPGPDVVPSWATVTTRSRRIRRRRRLGRATLAFGVMGAIVVVVVYLTSPGETSSRSVVASPGPSDVATTTSSGDASDAAASVIPAGQYRYVRVTGTRTATVVVEPDQSYTVVLPTTYEFWVGADDSGRIRIDDGAPTFLTPENEQVFNDSGASLPTLSEHTDRPVSRGDMHSLNLAELPVDSGPLREALTTRTHTGPSDNAERLLEGLSDNLWTTYGPPRNSRALMSALISTPGMDVRRSDGMTIVSAEKDGIRKEIWFVTDTGEIHRRRQVIVDAAIPSALHAPNGTVLEDASLEVAAIVPSIESTK